MGKTKSLGTLVMSDPVSRKEFTAIPLISMGAVNFELAHFTSGTLGAAPVLTGPTITALEVATAGLEAIASGAAPPFPSGTGLSLVPDFCCSAPVAGSCAPQESKSKLEASFHLIGGKLLLYAPVSYNKSTVWNSETI